MVLEYHLWKQLKRKNLSKKQGLKKMFLFLKKESNQLEGMMFKEAQAKKDLKTQMSQRLIKALGLAKANQMVKRHL